MNWKVVENHNQNVELSQEVYDSGSDLGEKF